MYFRANTQPTNPSARVQLAFLMVAIPAIAMTATGCASTSADREARMPNGFIWYFDGAGGGGLTNWGGGVKKGFLAAGYNGAGEMAKWNTGLGLAADQAASVEYKRNKASAAAKEIVNYKARFPQAPVSVMGLSAGTAVAVFALEALPESVQVENVVLLSGSISSDYDLTAALKRVKHRMYVTTSQTDGVLRYLVPLAGTADRKSSSVGVAGVEGFIAPAAVTEETRRQYAKVVHIPWVPGFRYHGAAGGHTDVVKAKFVRDFVAPLVMQRADLVSHMRKAGGGRVRNPDFIAWEKYVVGDGFVVEGEATIDGQTHRSRVTETLAGRFDGAIAVRRTFELTESAARAVPQTKGYFIPEYIDRGDHPLTCRSSLIKELKREPVEVDGKKIPCRVVSVSNPRYFPEWGEGVEATFWLADDVPAGLGRVEIKSRQAGHGFTFRGEVKHIEAAGTGSPN